MAVNLNTFVHTAGLLPGGFTDLIPGLNVTDDVMLCAIFGGIVNGIAISLCLLAGATSGGTDFIQLSFSLRVLRF